MNLLFYVTFVDLFCFVWSQFGTNDCTVLQFPANISLTEETRQGTVLANVSECSGSMWSMVVESPTSVSNDYFRWSYKSGWYTLLVNRSVDLELIYELHDQIVNNIRLRFSNLQNQVLLVIEVIPVNEFEPQFLQAPYVISLPEDTAVNSTVFNLTGRLSDRDVKDYVADVKIVPARIQEFEGSGYFSLEDKEVYLATPLDFEKMSIESLPYFNLGLKIYDTGNKSASTEMKILVTDVDEPPIFIRSTCVRSSSNPYPWTDRRCIVHNYNIFIARNGVVTAHPHIHAIDYDIADNSVQYSLDDLEMLDNLTCSVTINASTAIITRRCAESAGSFDLDQFYEENKGIGFNITIRAHEVTVNSLNSSLPVTLYFGGPPTTPQPSSTSVPSSAGPQSTPRVTTDKPTDKTEPAKTVSDNDTAYLLKIIIPTVAGIIILVVIVYAVLKTRGTCKPEAETAYDLNKRQSFYLAYENDYGTRMTSVGEKGRVVSGTKISDEEKPNGINQCDGVSRAEDIDLSLKNSKDEMETKIESG